MLRYYSLRTVACFCRHCRARTMDGRFERSRARSALDIPVVEVQNVQAPDDHFSSFAVSCCPRSSVAVEATAWTIHSHKLALSLARKTIE